MVYSVLSLPSIEGIFHVSDLAKIFLNTVADRTRRQMLRYMQKGVMTKLCVATFLALLADPV